MHRALIALAIGCGSRRPLVDQLEAELAALRLRNAELRAELAATGAVRLPEATRATLAQLFRDERIDVLADGPGVVIRIPVGRLFADPWALTPGPDAARVLDLLALALAQHPDAQLQVHGHTDDDLLPLRARNRFRDQTELSFEQAAWLAERLTREHGLTRPLALVAHGGARPIASDHAPDGRDANRRIEVVLLPERPAAP